MVRTSGSSGGRHVCAGETNATINREAWRYTGQFSRFNRLKNAFPGLGIATVAFAAYCGYEYFFVKDEHHHGEEHH